MSQGSSKIGSADRLGCGLSSLDIPSIPTLKAQVPGLWIISTRCRNWDSYQVYASESVCSWGKNSHLLKCSPCVWGFCSTLIPEWRPRLHRFTTRANYSRNPASILLSGWPKVRAPCGFSSGTVCKLVFRVLTSVYCTLLFSEIWQKQVTFSTTCG